MAVLEKAEIERLVGRPLRLSLEDILGHPDFADACRLYLDHFLKVYGGDPFLVRLLIESGRFFVYNLTVVLEAAQDPACRDTWPTVGLLKEKMAILGMASGRHIDDLIARLCAVGYMELRPSDQDRRIRILKTTEKLRAHDRDWLAAHYAPLAFLYPQNDYGLVMRRDPEFQAAYRSICIQFMPVAAGLLASMPDMMLFFDRAAGYMVMAALLLAASAEPDHRQAGVSYADVGERFGVSRTHVRKLLVAAEQAGLVKLHARGGHRVEILPRLWSSHSRSVAGGMYLHDMLYLKALGLHSAQHSRKLFQDDALPRS